MTSPPYAGQPGAASLSPSEPPAVDVAGEITDHRGEPRRPDRELFGMPPPEIGRVLSAESTLPPGKDALPLPVRLLIVLLAGAAVYGAVWYLTQGMRPTDRETLRLLLGGGGAVAAAVLAGYLSGFRHRCTYVGTDGVAQFELRGGRDRQPSARVLRFADAAEVRASQTRQFVNGIYTGTEYDYRWTDASGRDLLRLKGTHRGKNGPPKAGSAFHFASAAEVAWSIHYLDRAQEQLEREGSIAFRVDKRRVVRVGPGFMEFHFGDEPVRVTVEEIANVTLGDGLFSFVHKDARWYRSAGKYRFQYGQMANGKVFFLALDKLTGYRWE